MANQLDGELDLLVPLLLKKSGAASSGRDTFLAHHADRCNHLHMCVGRDDYCSKQLAERCVCSHAQGTQHHVEQLLALEICGCHLADCRQPKRSESQVQGGGTPGH